MEPDPMELEKKTKENVRKKLCTKAQTVTQPMQPASFFSYFLFTFKRAAFFFSFFFFPLQPPFGPNNSLLHTPLSFSLIPSLHSLTHSQQQQQQQCHALRED